MVPLFGSAAAQAPSIKTAGMSVMPVAPLAMAAVAMEVAAVMVAAADTP